MALPSNLVKCSIFFQQDGKGWSESFLYKGLSEDLGVHADWLRDVITFRRKLMGENTKIHAYRVSFETDAAGNPVVGDSLLRYVDRVGMSGQTSEDANTALLITQRNSTRKQRRNVFMRGIWDSIVENGGVYNVTLPAWVAVYEPWISAMRQGRTGVKEGGAGWVHRSASTADRAVTGYTFTDDTRCVLTFAPALVFAGQVKSGRQHVRVTGVNVASPLNGDLLVDVDIDGVHMTTVKPIAAKPFVSPGKVRFYEQGFTEALDYDGQKIVERRVGAPLLEQRGRSKAKPKA